MAQLACALIRPWLSVPVQVITTCFNCVTIGLNVRPVQASVPPLALAICPSFPDNIYGETYGSLKFSKIIGKYRAIYQFLQKKTRNLVSCFSEKSLKLVSPDVRF